MAIEPEELEEIPPQGHVKILYTGSVAPHWEIHRVFGDQRAIDEFRQRAMARLQLLPVYDPQFRRNRERVARDAEREHLILEWDLGEEPENWAGDPEAGQFGDARARSRAGGRSRMSVI